MQGVSKKLRDDKHLSFKLCKEFMNSVEENDLDTVKFYLEECRDDVDPRIYDNLAVLTACTNNFPEIVEFLLKYNCVDPTGFDNYAIKHACEYGHIRVFELLWKYYWSSDKYLDAISKDLLTISCHNNQLEIVQMLLKDEMIENCDFIQIYGLDAACGENHLKIINLILNNNEQLLLKETSKALCL